ncbi:Uncharacterised protein [Priestia megaterium]|nr:Uncharacterised protein [Priestia megaterium]
MRFQLKSIMVTTISHDKEQHSEGINYTHSEHNYRDH